MTKADRYGETIVNFKNRFITILAIVLILSGLVNLILLTDSARPDVGRISYDLISALVKILMAILIIFDPKRSIYRAIGFYAMSIAISRTIYALITLADVSDFSLIYGGALLILGLNLIYSSYKYMSDTVRGRWGMLIGSTLMALMEVLGILVEIQNFFVQGEFDSFWVLTSVLTILQYALLLVVLDTAEVRYGTQNEQSSTKLESVRVTNVVDPRYRMRQKEAEVLSTMFSDRSGWAPLDDGGPVECEKRIRTVEGRIGSSFILQKWKDSERIYVTVTNNDSGSIILANRFSITEVATDRDGDRIVAIRLFDGNRMLAQFSVMTEVEENEAQ